MATTIDELLAQLTGTTTAATTATATQTASVPAPFNQQTLLNSLISGISFTAPIIGTAGNDTLNGTAASDGIAGGAGNDTIKAGAGNDLVAGGDGVDFIQGEAGNNILFGQNDADLLVGGAGNDYLDGGAGNDLLLTGKGQNIVVTGAGQDTVLGGFINEAASGAVTQSVVKDFDVANDTVQLLNFESGSVPTYTVSALGTTGAQVAIYKTVNGQPVLNEVLYFENVTPAALSPRITGGQKDTGGVFGTATSGDDVITGDANNNIILGADGNDTLRDGAGNDGVYGQNGNDTLMGDAGNDTLVGAEGGDLVGIAVQNNQLVVSSAGNDMLDGGAGNDVLYDGLGTNQMITGAGSDIVVIGGESLSNAAGVKTTNTVTDFSVANDKIFVLGTTASPAYYKLEQAGADTKISLYTTANGTGDVKEEVLVKNATVAALQPRLQGGTAIVPAATAGDTTTSPTSDLVGTSTTAADTFAVGNTPNVREKITAYSKTNGDTIAVRARPDLGFGGFFPSYAVQDIGADLLIKIDYTGNNNQVLSEYALVQKNNTVQTASDLTITGPLAG
jgi:Ca2+-binding RTX toxin-like protein